MGLPQPSVGYKSNSKIKKPTTIVKMAASSKSQKHHRNMKRELHRLASFAKSSIHQVTLPSPLASAGLYYIHEADSVACFSCDWHCKIGDLYNDPVEQHRKESHRCDATGNKAAGNVPFGSITVDYSNTRLATPVGSRLPHRLQCLPNINPTSGDRNDDDLASVPFGSGTVGINGDLASDGSIDSHMTHYHSSDSSSAPPHENIPISNVSSCVQVIGPPKSRDEERWQRMKHEDQRLATFSDWPVDCPVSKEAVAKAGLYYIGPYDRVRCGFCYNVLKRWESGDVPQKEHKKYFPRCPFILNPDTCGNIPMVTTMTTTQEETVAEQMVNV